MKKEDILQALEEASALTTQLFNELTNGVLPGDQLEKRNCCQTIPGDPNTFLGGSNHPTFENHAAKALESRKNLGEKNRENTGIVLAKFIYIKLFFLFILFLLAVNFQR